MTIVKTPENEKPARLFGLVLTGGRSQRMGQDKALMKLGDKGQAVRAIELLSEVTERTFLSSREGQWAGTELESLPQIFDRFLGFGPLGGILTAQVTHPDVAWLVLACDLPFLDRATLRTLRAGRDPSRIATAYASTHGGKHKGLPEPLCAIYEPRSRIHLMEQFALGHYCPRKALICSSVKLLQQPLPGALENINSPEDYVKAQEGEKGADA